MENKCESKLNYKNHYHLGERNTTAINIMSGIKSLVCDLNGIIIAEMVYRCMICDVIYETIPDVQIHYQTKHIDQDLQTNSSKATNSSMTSKAKPGNTTNVSFFGSFQSTTDLDFDNTTDSSTTHTLTFDVPSGLKTLQQQFESSAKGVQHKKRTNKPFTSGNSKTKTAFNQKSKGQMTSSPIKSGLITCEICGATKFYKYTQRRYGVYSCVGCAKFYSKYLLKPVNYMCENLGKCNLKVSECEPNGRCKACLIHKCKSKFIIDPKKVTNFSKIGSNLSRNENKKLVNECKPKTNSKSISAKDVIRNIKTKSLNTIPVESKPKSNLTTNKTKNESDSSSQNKINNLVSNKRLKSDKTNQKNINQKTETLVKKSTNASGISKAHTNKLSLSRGMKRNILKSTEIKLNETRTRSQSSCRKCFGSKGKDCSNCANGLDSTKIGGKDKIRQKLLKRSYCLTRNRNK